MQIPSVQITRLRILFNGADDLLPAASLEAIFGRTANRPPDCRLP